MKPIFTVKIPNSCNVEKEIKEMHQYLKTELYDYHVIVVASEVREVTFECFNTQCDCKKNSE
jgi:hypothetical protein